MPSKMFDCGLSALLSGISLVIAENGIYFNKKENAELLIAGSFPNLQIHITCHRGYSFTLFLGNYTDFKKNEQKRDWQRSYFSFNIFVVLPSLLLLPVFLLLRRDIGIPGFVYII